MDPRDKAMIARKLRRTAHNAQERATSDHTPDEQRIIEARIAAAFRELAADFEERRCGGP